MKVYDCFLFFNELELLELRLEVLKDVVDYHVLVESEKTHTGDPKPFYFEENKDRFKKYLDKIIHIKVEDTPARRTSMFGLEVYQRNNITRGLEAAQPEDKIIISDVDEIPNPEVIKQYLRDELPRTLTQDLYYYFVNCRSDRKWDGPIMYTHGKNHMTPQELRSQARYGLNKVENGGWHYSYLGGIKGVKEKLKTLSDAHTRIDDVGTDEDITRKIQSHRDLWDERVSHEIVNISEGPPELKDFVRKYPHVLFNNAD